MLSVLNNAIKKDDSLRSLGLAFHVASMLTGKPIVFGVKTCINCIHHSKSVPKYNLDDYFYNQRLKLIDTT